MIRISALAMALGGVMTVVSQLLLWLIEVITAFAFHGSLNPEHGSPLGHQWGWWVIFVPAAGGIVIGLMARFGSAAIRGHGIPEAMAQVLENNSRIPARITWLKPLSAAISIGTGGPFGAEGPIIATGGATGSLLGQILPASAAERKTLLAAGAAAGMTATFGSPLSALLLAVELLLFEFKPRSLIPVTLAVGVAEAVRATWIGMAPVFPMPVVAAPSSSAYFGLLVVALIMGAIAFGVSRAVYWIEDAFEKLPVHWMWWPAIGGLAVGVIGWIEPRTFGVGYENITANLAGSGALLGILIFTALKFTSWSVALGSGTSGGTLAPLMTIGSAMGWALGLALQAIVPGADPHLAALVGMACMFGGASQAMLASAVFAFETTGQSNALFTLLSCCAVSVWVARAFGKTSIMTEKIERRGVSVPSQFGVDIFEHTPVRLVMDVKPVTVNAETLLSELAQRIANHDPSLRGHHAHPVLSEGRLIGIITRGDVLHAIETAPTGATVGDYATTSLVTVRADDTLHEAIRLLLHHDIGRLPVVAADDEKKLIGYLSRGDILSARSRVLKEEAQERRAPRMAARS